MCEYLFRLAYRHSAAHQSRQAEGDDGGGPAHEEAHQPRRHAQVPAQVQDGGGGQLPEAAGLSGDAGPGGAQ